MPEDGPSSEVLVDVLIENPLWLDLYPRAETELAAAIEAALRSEGRAGAVAVLLADDARLQGLNAAWRGKDKPTNVLSFPAPDGAGGALGDIALAAETIAAEAADQGKTIAAHAAHLAVHGFLHLIGYDHETEEEAAEMEAREREILASLGISDPYMLDFAPPND